MQFSDRELDLIENALGEHKEALTRYRSWILDPLENRKPYPGYEKAAEQVSLEHQEVISLLVRILDERRTPVETTAKQ